MLSLAIPASNLDAVVVGVLVKPELDAQALAISVLANQLHDRLMGQLRFAAPVMGSEDKKAMLDAVLFSGAWRRERHGDEQTRPIGQRLQPGPP
jgi:hypothetical protein